MNTATDPTAETDIDGNDVESEEMAPQGIKWYGDWMAATYFLPRACHLPVQVDRGTPARADFGFQVTITGDWRQVWRWRKVRMTAAALRRARKVLKVEAQEIELMG